MSSVASSAKTGSRSRPRRTGRFFLLLGGITLLALLLRLTAGFQLWKNDPSAFAPASVTDMRTYLNLSAQIASGKIPEVFYYQPFYYGVFLPFLRLFQRGGNFSPWLVQAVLGAASVWLAGLCGARAMGKKAGIFAAILAAGSFMLVLYPAYALLEILQSFFFILLLYLTFESLRKRKKYLWFLTGLILGCAILTRGNAWCFLPVIAGGMVFVFHRQWQSMVTAFFILMAGTLLPQLPFAIVNSCYCGTLSGPSTAGGNVLALGNTPEAPPGELVYPKTYEVWTGKKSLQEKSVPQRIFEWAKDEPAAFLELQFRKFFLFWNRREIPNNIHPERNASCSPLLRTIPLIPTGGILVLAIGAFFMNLKTMVKTRRYVLLLNLFILFYALAAAAFYILGRFRIPAIPLCCSAAGCVIPSLIRAWHRKRNLLAGAVLSLFLGWVIVYPGYDIYREYYEPAVMRIVRPRGVMVPSETGGIRLLDHGPLALGGWSPVERSGFIKRFAPRFPVPAGIPVRFSICVVRTGPDAFLEVNGHSADLTGVQENRPLLVTIALPCPADGQFRVTLSGNIRAIADFQRDYGRTLAEDGSPFPAELVAELEIQP